MAYTHLVSEDEATGKVKEIFEAIKAQVGIDFVPYLYRVMALKPDYLEANWNKVQAVMVKPGKLSRLTKEIIAIAISSVLACDY